MLLKVVLMTKEYHSKENTGKIILKKHCVIKLIS